MRLFLESDLLTCVDIRPYWLVLTTECKIFFCDPQEKNAKKVEITEFYYQQNNEQVLNIGSWSLFLTRAPVAVEAEVSYSERQIKPFFLRFDMIRSFSPMISVISAVKTPRHYSRGGVPWPPLRIFSQN